MRGGGQRYRAIVNRGESVDPVLMAALDPVLSDLGRTPGVVLKMRRDQPDRPSEQSQRVMLLLQVKGPGRQRPPAR